MAKRREPAFSAELLNEFLEGQDAATVRLRIWFTGDVLVPRPPLPTGGIQ